MVENYEKAEQDYKSGMKYKDIAKKYGTTINTVKSWRKRYGWCREEGAPKTGKGCTQKREGAQKEKGAHQQNIEPVHETADEDYDGTRETLKNSGLTAEQQMFCIYYSRTFNATQSYLKAYGSSYDVANAEGYKLLVKPCVRKEIERLKEIKRQQIIAGAEDIVELQMRIAFSDIGNYLSFNREDVRVMGPFGPIKDQETGEYITKEVNVVKLSDSEMVDTQIIQEVKQGRDGVSMKLADKQKALDWLTMFFEMNPDDRHRKEFDKRKLELELMKLEMQTKDRAEDQNEQDNFMDALNESAKEMWKDD